MTLPFLRRGRLNRLMRATAVLYKRSGEWPHANQVERVLVDWGDRTTDAKRIAACMPAKLGRLDGDGRIVLTVRGIDRAEPGYRLLDKFDESVSLAATRYLENTDPNVAPTLSEPELTQELSLKDKGGRRLMGLLEEESIVSAGAADGGEATITSDIRPFLEVASLRDYLKTRRRIDRGHRVAGLLRKPGDLIRWFRSDGTSVWSKLVAAVLTAVIITLVVGGALGGCQTSTTTGDHNGTDQAEHNSRKSAAARSGG